MFVRIKIVLNFLFSQIMHGRCQKQSNSAQIFASSAASIPLYLFLPKIIIIENFLLFHLADIPFTYLL